MKKILFFILALLIIVGAFFGAKYIVESAPQAEKKVREKKVKKVRVQTVPKTAYDIVIPVMGKVVASQKSIVTPEVSGNVVYVNPKLMPGALVNKKDIMLKIDPSRYKLVVKLKKTDISQAKAELQRELGSQKVALKEYKLLGKKLSGKSRALILRKPQLDIARAKVAAAKSALKQAEIDLKSTVVKAPFSGIVINKNTDLGSRAASGSPVFTLVNAKKFWLEAQVPVKYLNQIKFKDKKKTGSDVTVIADPANNATRRGQVLRLLPDLDAQGLMAQVLVEVSDPLALKDRSKPRLLLNSYVQLNITGKTLQDVQVLPAEWLKNDNTLWLLSPTNELIITPVKLAYRTEKQVVISSGIDEISQIITSDMSVAVNGMKLQKFESQP